MPDHPASRLFLLAFLCVFLAASTPALAQGQEEAYVAKVDADGVQRVRIVGGEYFFKPSHIIVKVNVPVELTASKEAGITPHNIVIKAPEAGLAVEEDIDTEPKKITFTAKALGKYPIYCSNKLLFFASHRERGMEGVLEVVP
ncbi:MAG TPA: quinol oxidase [Burkholderiales bacterium]|jgi:plastocyanin|nr:quinol oxidase [Burkholderiales bacterium]